MIEFQPVKVDTSSADEEGQLVIANDRLIAVAVRLRDESHGEQRDRWHIEAVFNNLRAADRTFADLDDLRAWFSEKYSS